MIPVITFLILFFLSIVFFINRNGETLSYTDSRIVELSIDGTKEVIPTAAPTVGALLKQLKVTLNAGDVVEPSTNSPILINNFQINIYRVHPVTVVEGSLKTIIETANSDPRAIAEDAGYTIYPQDDVTTENNANNLGQNVLGDEVVINPAIPVNLDLYGSQVVIRTHAQTVGDLLSEEKIKTSSGNNVLPTLTTPITTNMQIDVVPVGQKLISTQAVLPYSVQRVADSSIAYGNTAIEQAGVNGLALEVETVSASGVVSPTPLQEVVVNQPVPEIIGNGTGAIPVASGDNISWLKSSVLSPNDYGYADYIFQHESNWHPASVNSRGCIGLGQSCPQVYSEPALAVECPDWQTDAVCQIDFFNSYVISHGYGTWANAAAFWETHGYW